MSTSNGARPPQRPHLPRRHGRLAALVVAALLVIGVLYAAIQNTSMAGLHTENNQLVESGQAIRLLGVGLSGTETACLDALGLRRAGLVPSLAALRSWKVDVVLVPIAADCWLGTHGGGASYQDAIDALVSLLHRGGFAVILSLDRISTSGPQPPLPDADTGDRVWNQIALRFRGDHRLLFDLYARPHGIGWDCWLNGCRRGGRRLAGMQELVNAVRAANARQPVILRGLENGSDLSGWLQHGPVDSASQLVAGFRLASGSPCAERACWQREVDTVAGSVPVVTVDMSESDCAHTTIDDFMNWADGIGVSYVGRSWRTGACEAPSLIRSRAGAPTAYGAGLRDHLRGLAGAG
jgi:endoglucanase